MKGAARPTHVRIGTSGWVYAHWRGPFYPKDLPARSWFAYYAARFDTVEVNNSFYRLPSAETFAGWAAQAPAGFLYAVKASRFLTHQKKLREPEGPLETFLIRARELGPHLGPVLFQLPPHWHCNPGRLRDFLGILPADVTAVFEFRDPSWYTEEVRALLAEAGADFCIHDLHAAPAPLWITSRAAYVRFHGPTEKAYSGRYPLPFLRKWAGRIADFRAEGHDVFVYFNNDDTAYAAVNALELKELTA